MTTARITTAAAGIDALRRRLDELPMLARAAVGRTLHEIAERAAADIQAALPADADAVRVEDAAADAGSLLVVDAPAARAREFGTSRTEARPVLRPTATTAAQAAGPAMIEALRSGLAGERS